MKVQFALYKGPPHDDWWHWVCHYAVRLWTWSRWSHIELVVDGVCYSASPRDGGVRSKVIDLASGRWDVVDVEVPEERALRAVSWFLVNTGDKYDWAGIWRFVLPFLPHSESRWFCFESVGEAMGFPASFKLTANDFYRWAMARKEADGK